MKDLTMEDVKNLHHNLDWKEKNDFQKNYHWNDDTLLTTIEASYLHSVIVDDKEVIPRFLANQNGLLGYALEINGQIEVLISVYEPHGIKILPDKSLVIAYGHETIVLYWLGLNEFTKIETR